MMTLKLYRHGEHSEQLITDELSEIPKQPQDGTNFSGLIKRFDKHTRVHENGMSMGWVTRKYADAVEFTGCGWRTWVSLLLGVCFRFRIRRCRFLDAI